MKKQINGKTPKLLIYSVILFSTAIYFMSDSLILGASAGGGVVSTPPPSSVIEQSTPESAPDVQKTDADSKTDATTPERNTESQKNEVPKEVYIVKSGQTLWEIAQDTGLSIQALMNKNQLSNSVIVEGQELVFDK
ncbi:LysM peptidoglycan-binding domain-containing protein [Candidatus Enterococcus mansonii]|uniref:LysM domain-containing protein n=1 Tax=Candidatus Enterococcus mansonii TaxID=1834181 RepID=A0A242CGU1_9ENTE|nr:LysM peptidoglycan-binding domain-containing protein [Enterococcus sp. 4G2_DIV0659]OTO09431.1 hypothetical protein A5880_000110 [Enterococcus sp. 4G2_DIV0659]